MRRLYLIAYDVTDPRRLNKVRELLKAYSTGGLVVRDRIHRGN